MYMKSKTRCNFSLAARYSLKLTPCLLLVVKSLVTRCKIHSLLVAEVIRCKNLLITRCRSCSLQKITRYSLQNSLITRCRSCLLQIFTRYSLPKLLVSKIRSLLVAKRKIVSRCEIRLLLVATNRLLLYAKNHSSLVKTIAISYKVRWKFSFFNIICWSQKIQGCSKSKC